MRLMHSGAACSVCSPPPETRACPGFASSCASRASPTCGGEGLGVGVPRLGSAWCLNRTTPSPTLPQLQRVYARLRRALGGGSRPSFVAALISPDRSAALDG